MLKLHFQSDQQSKRKFVGETFVNPDIKESVVCKFSFSHRCQIFDCIDVLIDEES